VHPGQGLSPIEPAREPDQGVPYGVASAPWLDVSCAREGELCAQKQVFRRQGSGWVQTEEQVTHAIVEER
jgi:hypothetical protein